MPGCHAPSRARWEDEDDDKDESRQLTVRGESNRKMKHADDTQWVTNPTRKRPATDRKRTLRRRPAMAARSVWSECQSRVTEPRNSHYRPGLHSFIGGGCIAAYAVRHLLGEMRAMCAGTGPGSKSGAKAYWGIQRSWESRHWPCDYRTRTPPVDQRPCRKAQMRDLPERIGASNREPVSELNRSDRETMIGSLSDCIVAMESRETMTGGSL